MTTRRSIVRFLAAAAAATLAAGCSGADIPTATTPQPSMRQAPTRALPVRRDTTTASDSTVTGDGPRGGRNGYNLGVGFGETTP